MILSINPWYYCNFHCEFCYLTPEQLSDKTLLPLNRLEEMLSEISSECTIDMVDIYGGEVGLLPLDYWNDMIDMLRLYGIKNINIITNLSMVNEITTDPRVHTSVSYDFNAREQHQRVWRNMALLNKEFSVLILAGPDLIGKDVDDMVNTLNVLNNLISVEIKPYSTNQANQFNIPYTMYEDFVKKWIEHPNKNFEFVNEALLESVLNKTRNSFSNDHVYITPNGKYGVLEFDLNDNEFFKEYDTFDEYLKWCDIEHDRVSNNKFCNACEYYGNCLSEHLRDVKSVDESCNGFSKLIKWYTTGPWG
jgi:sulfatase maturation enzyme AslB (radical SAM superfamily)